MDALDPLYRLMETITRFMDAGPPLFFGLLLIVVLGPPLTLLHEVGHALAARRLLGTTVEVTVGNKVTLTHLRLGEILFEINAAAMWTGPAGQAVFDDSRARARDVLLIALAGPAASLAGAVGTGLLLQASTPGNPWHDVMHIATLLGVGIVALNLTPMELTERSGERWRTDGRLALDAYRTLRAFA